MKLERAVPCITRLRLGRTPFGFVALPAIIVGASVALATLIVGLHA